MRGNSRAVFLLAGALLAPLATVAQPAKDLITLDEFMNATDVKEVKLSPDGSAAIIATEFPDWQHNRFSSDLWIWKQKTGETVPLTRSGHAHAPQWSPDGRYIVGGNGDVRVSYLEDVLLERALQQLQVPHSLLVFPGEGHSLDKNPWHGYVKVREELQWLEKYSGPNAR